MTLTPGERYSIVYREGGEEKTAIAHYRGFGTSDEISRGAGSIAVVGGDAWHWFKIDGRRGYLSLEEDDLIEAEPAEGYT